MTRTADLRCTNCLRKPRPDEDTELWRARSDGVGELHLFCPECDKREFGQSESSSDDTKIAG